MKSILNSLFTALATLSLMWSCHSLASQPLIISEASSANTVFTDEDEEAGDWIELHNPGAEPFDLSGFRLSDRSNFGRAWSLPFQMLGAGRYLRIWASGKNRRGSGLEHLHADFRLASSGETIYLFDPAGALIDELPLVRLPANTSRGRNAAGQLVYFARPTPGSENEPSEASGLNNDGVTFSHPGGPTGPLQLTLSGGTGSAGAVIRFTTDGSMPNGGSSVYTAPLTLEVTTVIRAAVFRPDFLRGPVSSATYVIDEPHDLPVVTLTTEPRYFFSDELGIYVPGDGPLGPFPYYGANYWRDWERPVEVAIYSSEGKLETAFPAGVQIFGGINRTKPQRSLSVFARNAYGVREIAYPLFPDLAADSYQAFVLRNSGNDWNRTMLRDAVMTGLMSGSGVDHQAYRPVEVYLNGEYWGIQNMREKVNEHFIAAHHDLEPEEVNLLELDGRVIEGDAAGYPELVSYFQDNDFRQSAAYARADSLIDLDNLIRYNIAQIYFGNTDWPHNNVKFWRVEGGKWRWILFDTDYGFGHWGEDDVLDDHLTYAIDALGRGWPGQLRASLFLRKLLRNEDFQHRFINQFADEMNSRFLSPSVSALIDSLSGGIESEIPDHFRRWNSDPAGWASAVDRMHRFGQLRPDIVKQNITDYWGLPGHQPVRIINNTPKAGAVRLNSLTLTGAEWTGDYFTDVPITLTALPEAGYEFSYWVGDTFSLATSIQLDPDRPREVAAVFQRRTAATGGGSFGINHLLPNPSTGRMYLEYELTEGEEVSIDLIDMRGRVIKTLWSGQAMVGKNAQIFSCNELLAGVYLVRISQAGKVPVVRRWVKR